MKRYIYTLCVMTVALMGVTSCLKDSDTTEVTVYDDAAVATFSLTAVNRYVHTKGASGNDSVYKQALTVSKYVFTIDQYQRKIYNTDSLPADCDLKHVLASITASGYSGGIYLKNIGSDTLTYYNSTDSINFSEPRELRVYNNSYETYRAYQVQVNVKKGTTLAVNWEDLSGTGVTLPAAIGQEVEAANVGDHAFSLSLDGGTTWSQEQLGEDEDAALLPQTWLSYVSMPLNTGKGLTYHVLTGVVSAADTAYTVWRKMADEGVGQWVMITREKRNTFCLPTSERISLAYHGQRLLAVTRKGTIYVSSDQGITWKRTTSYNLPNGLEATDLRAATDAEGRLWLVSQQNGAVWRGTFIE